MKKNLPSFLSFFSLVFFVAFASSSYVFFQEKKATIASFQQLYKSYTMLMERQISQDWFKTTLQLGAFYAAEKQLFDFSDDFFSKGVIHNDKTILGGFGYSISSSLPSQKPARGSFSDQEGFVYYRVPVSSKTNLAITFSLNHLFILKKFQTIEKIKFNKATQEVTASLSVFRSLKKNSFDLFILIVCFSFFALLVVLITKSLLNSRKEIEKNDIQNHDLRVSSFNTCSFLYWVRKYIDSPNSTNRNNLLKEVSELEIVEEVNQRIFTNTRDVPRFFSVFCLDFEIKKAICFLGIELDLSQLKIHPFSKKIKIKSELNSFTVLLINLLKNALRDIAGDLNKKCEFFVLESSDVVEIFVINDGFIAKPREILRKRRSLSNSSGLGLSIVQEQELILKTEVSLIMTKGKIVCSFALKKEESK